MSLGKMKALFLVMALGLITTNVNAAQGNISVDRRQSTTSYVEINHVSISVDGYLEIRAMRSGQAGDIMATESMNAGANRGRRIQLKFPQSQGVFLSLFSNDDVLLDSEKVIIKRRKAE